MPWMTDGPPTEQEKYDTVPVSNLIYTEENILSYRPGGYHPAQLGDTFRDGRYKIAHKLGWGGFGMITERKYASWIRCRRSRASKYVVELLNHFTIEGPNGRHLCIVMEFLGPSIHDVICDYVLHTVDSRMDADDVLRSSRLLLEMTAALHAAGFAHGDLSASNVAYTTKALQGLSTDEFFEFIGKPETAELVRVDGTPLHPGLPKQLVEKIQWAEWCHEDDEDLRFIDVAQVFPLHSPPKRLDQPFELRAPETIFQDKIDHRVDLWRVGCVIFLMAFHGHPISGMGDNAMFVACLSRLNDLLPDEWRDKYDEIQKTAKSRMFPCGPKSVPWLADIFKQKIVRGGELEELGPLQPIIAGLLRMRPEDRLSAREALQLFKDTIKE